MFTEYVRILSEGKEHIGQIVSINSTWETARDIKGDFIEYPVFYSVELLIKDKHYTFVKIRVNSLSEIQPYEVTE